MSRPLRSLRAAVVVLPALSLAFAITLLGAATLLATGAGCPGGADCPGLGQACTVYCCTGLDCRPVGVGGYGTCRRACRCEPGVAVCNSLTIKDGCPPGVGLCVATQPDGTGQCVPLCASPDGGTSCPPGNGACTRAPAGEWVCVSDPVPWAPTDGGAGD